MKKLETGSRSRHCYGTFTHNRAAHENSDMLDVLSKVPPIKLDVDVKHELNTDSAYHTKCNTSLRSVSVFKPSKRDDSLERF
jgi:hypothetical protein